MDDARSFHQRVYDLRPKQTTKPTTFWVAVLKAAVKPSNHNTEEDFLWIKCHGEIKASVIRAQYEQKNPADGKIKLKLGNLVAGDETMRTLDLFKDQLVIFEVVKASEASPQLPRGRSPLRPTTTQMKSPPPDRHDSPGLQDRESKIPGPMFQSIAPKSEGQDENLNPYASFQPSPFSEQSAPASMAAASVFPKAEPFAPSSVLTPRPDWATSKGFNYYEAKTREKMIAKWSHLNSGKKDLTLFILLLLSFLRAVAQVQNLILDAWLKFSSVERQRYEEEARQDEASHAIKLEPIKAELTVKDLLPIDQLTTDTSETQDVPKETFQLQKLLTEATPELLETSVEEGVRLLENLKSQMLTDSAASTDATQWIQQIGTHNLSTAGSFD